MVVLEVGSGAARVKVMMREARKRLRSRRTMVVMMGIFTGLLEGRKAVQRDMPEDDEKGVEIREGEERN